MELNLNELKKALAALQRAIKVTKKIEAGSAADPAEIETLRAGVIQAFEFSYELCWKMLKRWLEINVSPDIVAGVVRIELFRRGAENLLIDDVLKWMEFHDARNKTSHLYARETAEAVYQKAVEFLPYAQALLESLEKRR
ncbi:MAG: nucleotidyltransferase substrate binding protein [Candidatus Margulisbacteria bacterium]|jgi:nucleotidyltransferase substrate binding protein (TIGR01987 family)|nr:nucleotidyltransferase substrate binding protein [Candidatus Margulisiibacteriota bacterium]